MAVTKFDQRMAKQGAAKQAAAKQAAGVAEEASLTQANLAKAEQMSGHAPVHATIGTPGSGVAPVGSVNTFGQHKRKLNEATPSIDHEDAHMMASQIQIKKLRACDLKDMAGLEQLANEHFENFTRLLGNVGRPAGPDRTIVFGSACTGSAGHHVVMTAFKNACAKY